MFCRIFDVSNQHLYSDWPNSRGSEMSTVFGISSTKLKLRKTKLAVAVVSDGGGTIFWGHLD